ncbi:MAG: hypothetical protein ACRD4I_16670 [Candidatus Angelobacter sp.]
MFPGQPVIKGKAALRAYVSEKLENARIQNPLEVGKAGVLA